MKIIETRLLRGPNIHAFWPCIKLVIDLEELVEVQAGELRRIRERLLKRLDCLSRPSDAYDFHEQSAWRLQECLSIGKLVERVVLALQCLSGSSVTFGQTRQLSSDARYVEVVCGYRIEQVAEKASEYAVELVMSAVTRREIGLEAALQHLRELMKCSSTTHPGPGRPIPVIAVTGTNGKTTTTLLIASALRAAGRVTAVATSEGIFFNDQVIEKGDCTGYWSARTILNSPEAEVAVLETARGGILKRGLGFDHCDVAVILNVSEDHLGQDGIDSIEAMANVKSLVARTATGAVVLNAEDPYCVAMATRIRPQTEIVYFSCDEHAPVLRAHLERNGRAVYLHGEDVTLAHGDGMHRLLRADDLAVTLYGRARHNVANTLAAIAALMALGQCSHGAIVSGLRSFSCSTEKNPLRLNIFRVQGIDVWVDYAHNPAAYRAILDTAHAMNFRRVVGVVSAPADRRDAELQEIGRVCATQLDAMVVYEPDEERGRPRGETAHVLFESGVAAARGRILVQVVPDVRDAIWRAYTLCLPGDLLLFGGATKLEDLKTALARRSPTASRVLQERRPQKMRNPAGMKLAREASGMGNALPRSGAADEPRRHKNKDRHADECE